jgi:hypothetical protein
MSTRDSKSPRTVLQEDHRHIDALLDPLIAAVRAGDREAEAQSWAPLEASVLAHLDVEEMFVFPALTEAHPKEVEGLLREHARLREQLGALGLAIDLHTVRRETVEGFCGALREHAAREEKLAYEEAERRLPASLAGSIVERLARLGSKREAGRHR